MQINILGNLGWKWKNFGFSDRLHFYSVTNHLNHQLSNHLLQHKI